MQQRQEPTSESLYASLMEVPEHTPVREDRRSRRQSRVSREIVSQGTNGMHRHVLVVSSLTLYVDPTVSATPTREWQDQLSRRLAHGTGQWAYTTPVSPPSRSSSSAGGSAEYSRTRRRLDWPLSGSLQQNWDNLYTLPDTSRMSFPEFSVSCLLTSLRT